LSLDVLVVGGGSIGERHLRCFQQEGAGRVAICETLEERRTNIEQTYGVDGYGSIDRACEDYWDLVVIATPAHLHIGHALAFDRPDTAWMIEKPLSITMDRVEDLRRASEDRVVGVAYVYRAHPAFQRMKQSIDSGAFGEVNEVTITGGQHFPTFRPAYREIYYTDRATGGGAIQDATTHHFNLLQFLVGPLDWVFCDYDHQALPGVTVEDTVHASGRCGRVMMNISMNQFMAPNENVVQVNCSGGSLRANLHESRFGSMRHGEDWQWTGPLTRERDELFRNQASHTLRALTGEVPVLCSLDEAIHTLRINLAALESRGAKRVEIPHG